jgi:hypothetical protein
VSRQGATTASERDARLAPGDKIANVSAEDQSNFLEMGFARGLGCDRIKANDSSVGYEEGRIDLLPALASRRSVADPSTER